MALSSAVDAATQDRIEHQIGRNDMIEMDVTSSVMVGNGIGVLFHGAGLHDEGCQCKVVLTFKSLAVFR